MLGNGAYRMSFNHIGLTSNDKQSDDINQNNGHKKYLDKTSSQPSTTSTSVR